MDESIATSPNSPPQFSVDDPLFIPLPGETCQAPPNLCVSNSVAVDVQSPSPQDTTDMESVDIPIELNPVVNQSSNLSERSTSPYFRSENTTICECCTCLEYFSRANGRTKSSGVLPYSPNSDIVVCIDACPSSRPIDHTNRMRRRAGLKLIHYLAIEDPRTFGSGASHVCDELVGEGKISKADPGSQNFDSRTQVGGYVTGESERPVYFFRMMFPYCDSTPDGTIDEDCSASEYEDTRDTTHPDASRQSVEDTDQ